MSDPSYDVMKRVLDLMPGSVALLALVLFSNPNISMRITRTLPCLVTVRQLSVLTYYSPSACPHLLLALSVVAQKFANPHSRATTPCNKQDNGLQFRTLGPLPPLLPVGPPWAATFPLQPWLTHQFPRGGRVPAGHLVPDAHTSTPSTCIPTHTH